MKVTVERTPGSEAVLNVSLDWDEVEKASDKAYKKLAQKYNVPGFRKGHAPRTMLERMLGREAIYQEGLEDLIDASYREAIREHDLTPVAQPSVEAPPIEIGQPYSFTARVPILSPVTLGDYASVRVPVPSAEVGEEDVEQTLERMRENAAMWLPAERAAQVGDQVTADLKLTVEDKVVSDLKDNEFELAIERPGIFAGMDDHLVGMREGERAEFTTTIPEDYANTALAGKEGHYDVTIKAVKYKELPELDDEFAKSQGNYQTLDQLRDIIRQQLQRQKEGDARRELRDEVAKAVADQAEVEIHPMLVDDEVHQMMREQDRMLKQNGLNLEYYLSMLQKDEETYHKELEPEALGRVKRDLVLTAVADAEDIQVGDDELENMLRLMTALGGKPTRLRQLSATQRASLAARLRRDKAMTRLIEIATEGKGDSIGASAAAAPTSVEDEAVDAAADAVAEREASEIVAQAAAREGAALASATDDQAANVATVASGTASPGDSPQSRKVPESQAASSAGTEVPQSGA